MMSIYLEGNAKVPAGADETVVSRAFWLWGYQIAYEMNPDKGTEVTAAQLSSVYSRLLPIWQYTLETMDAYFVNPEDFIDTRWHYMLVKTAYDGHDISHLLRRMRSHRYQYLSNSSSDDKHSDYRDTLNATPDLKTELLSDTHTINNVHIKAALRKKWHAGTCQINLSSITALETAGLFDSIQSYHELKTMIHYLENYQDIKLALLEYFAPTQTYLNMLVGLKLEYVISDRFIDFIKEKKDSLSFKQYQSLLQYSLLQNNPLTFDFSRIENPRAFADAYTYAFSCLQDDIDVILKSTHSETAEHDKAIKKYRMGIILNDYMMPYMNVYYTCMTKPYSIEWASAYMQRLINWIDDDLRWCFNHPYKSFTLLVVGLSLSLILEMFAPVMFAVGMIAAKLHLRTPAWLYTMGTVMTGRGVGFATRLLIGKQHPILHFANRAIRSSVHTTVRAFDFERARDVIVKLFKKEEQLVCNIN